MMRDQCIDLLYAEVEKEVPVSRVAYGNSLYDWSISPILANEKQIGVLMLRNHEIHIQLQKDKALVHMRKVIRQCAADNLKRLGYLLTRSDDNNEVIHFLERLGFYRTGMDGNLITFRLDELKIK